MLKRPIIGKPIIPLVTMVFMCPVTHRCVVGRHGIDSLLVMADRCYMLLLGMEFPCALAQTWMFSNYCCVWARMCHYQNSIWNGTSQSSENIVVFDIMMAGKLLKWMVTLSWEATSWHLGYQPSGFGTILPVWIQPLNTFLLHCI